MNRRSFFKVVTGFIGGVFAVFAPKAIGKRPPTKAEFQSALTEVVKEKFESDKVMDDVKLVFFKKGLSAKMSWERIWHCNCLYCYDPNKNTIRRYGPRLEDRVQVRDWSLKDWERFKKMIHTVKAIKNI